MKTSRLAALPALLFLVACGKDPVAPDPLAGPLTGQWTAQGHPSVIVEVGIEAPGTRTLTGCIAVGYDPVARPNDRVTVRMRGSQDGRSVRLEPEPGSASIWSFTGTRQALDTLVGTGTLGDGPGAPVTLTRVAPGPNC